MFRVVTIQGIADEEFNEESFLVEEAFFFTITVSSYYTVYNKVGDVIGIIPNNYNLFFKVDEHHSFEDIDMVNVLRLFEMGEKFFIVGTKNDSSNVTLIGSDTISKFEFVEDYPIDIPFTNKSFDSEGIVVFKNMTSLADSIEIDRLF
jgi:hypothetical protein